MTRQIRVGGVPIGGAPVTIQSMTNTRTDDVSATAEQIKRLAAAGCEIVRVAVPDLAAARAVGGHSGAEPHPSGGGHPFRLPAGPGVRGRRVRQSAHQSGQHRRGGPGEGGGRRLPPKGDSHPYRSQRRLPGEAHPGQIRRGDAGGPGGVGLWTYPPAGEI